MLVTFVNSVENDHQMTSILDFAFQQEQDESCFKLTWSQRMLGFAGTAIIGLFSGILSLIAIGLLRIRKFAILFAICNMMVLSSTGFLIGFQKQIKSLFEQKRYIATIGMAIGITITMLSAFMWKKLVLVVIGFIIEFLS